MTDITKSDLEAFYAAQEKRKELERAARALKAQEDAIAERIQTVLSVGETARRGEYRVNVVNGPQYPAWKDALLRIAPERVPEVIASTPPSVRVIVTRIDS